MQVARTVSEDKALTKGRRGSTFPQEMAKLKKMLVALGKNALVTDEVEKIIKQYNRATTANTLAWDAARNDNKTIRIWLHMKSNGATSRAVKTGLPEDVADEGVSKENRRVKNAFRRTDWAV